MKRFFLRTSVIPILAIILAACSGGGNPTTPFSQDTSSLSARLPIYVNPAPEGMIAGTGALGVYQVSINTENMTFDVVPLRTSSFVPGQYEVDLTLALTGTFCKDCFKINSMGLAGNGNILLDVGVKHPFRAITTIPAPTSQRPDLHVFDVQGIVVAEGSLEFTRSTITLNPTFVANADGFTTAFDNAIDSLGPSYATTANAHAFKILSKGNYVNPADEIGNYDIYSLNGYPSPAGLINPTGFNVMKCGSGYMNTQYELDTPTSLFSFMFVVTCSFGESGKRTGTELQRRSNPIYLMPAFSKPEAWKVNVVVENNGLRDNSNTETADVVVRACDWQQAFGHLPADPAFDPSVNQSTQKNTLLKASSINLIQIDIPGLNTPMDDTTSVVPSGSGSYLSPRTYRIQVNNDTYASEIPDPNNPPQFWGLAAVRDDLYGTPNPVGGIDHDLKIPDSMFEISDYTTYQVFGISIFPPNDPPVPVIECTNPVAPPFPLSINSGDSPDFTGVNSFDIDGSIISYEWDFDYDPVTEVFNVDFTDSDPAVAADPPPWKMNNTHPVPSSKYVALRVTDDSAGAWKSVGYVQVDISANQPPIADLGVCFYNTPLTAPYTFYEGERVTLRPGPLTWDDGQIDTYQYDFDYDSVIPFFTVDAANTNGAPVLSPIQAQGSIDMATRVWDNGDPPGLQTIDWDTITINARAANIPIQINADPAASVDLDNSGLHAVAVSATMMVCAWTQSGNLTDIYYSTSSDGGATWTPQAVLNTTTNGTQRMCSLASNASTDTFYAVFETNESGAYAIKSAVSNVGATAWPTQTIVAPSTDVPADPSIAVGSLAARIYVAYQGVDLSLQDAIFTRVSSDNGVTYSARLGINTTGTGDRTDPCIAFCSTDNQVGVAWDDSRSGTYYQIYFNWSDATGTAFQASDVRIASTTASQNDPSLAAYGGNWFVSYDDLSATSDIYFSSSADGSLWSFPVDITDNSDSQHNDSSLCAVDASTIYISTTDSRESGFSSDRDIYVFKSTDGGTTWVRGIRADTGLLGENAYKPNICRLPGIAGFVVMYESPDNKVFVATSNAY